MLKVAREVTNPTVKVRPLFNVFLIGTGVSIGYGVLGGAFIDWLSGSDVPGMPLMLESCTPQGGSAWLSGS